MNSLIKHITFFIILVTFSQFTSATSINCENCANPQSRAISSVGTNPGRYTVNVIDIAQEKISSYSIRIIDMGGEPGFPSIMIGAYALTTPTQLNSDFQQLLNDIESIKQDMVDVASTTDFGIDSAWDLYADNIAQGEFLTNFYNNPTYGGILANGINTILNGAGITVSIAIPITLENGAIIVLKFKTVIMNGILITSEYEIDFENSVDQYGNPLIIRPNMGGPNDGGATFPLYSNSLENFLEAARRAGIPITGGAEGLPDAPGNLTCEFVDDGVGGVKYVCTLRP